jgi:ABC-type protease/lipase transport system fused ATPase/permease subunit
MVSYIVDWPWIIIFLVILFSIFFQAYLIFTGQLTSIPINSTTTFLPTN